MFKRGFKLDVNEKRNRELERCARNYVNSIGANTYPGQSQNWYNFVIKKARIDSSFRRELLRKYNKVRR